MSGEGNERGGGRMKGEEGRGRDHQISNCDTYS